MYKISIQNKPLFLVDAIDSTIDEYLHRNDTIFMDELNSAAVKTMIKEMESPEIYAGVFLHSNLKELLDTFKAHLEVIIAAGGLVYTNKNELLLIFRKGKWDLPKGKLDEGEDLETCALREIEEETGAFGLKLEKPLSVSYHTYHERGKHILKESHWFLMKTSKKLKLEPQTEEDIERCEWVAIDNLSTYTINMHASIIDVIKAGIEMVRQKSH